MNLRSGAAVGEGVLSKQHRSNFEEGMDLVLSKWTALQMAIDQEWGGRSSRQKGEDMGNEVLDWFYRKKRWFAELEQAKLQLKFVSLRPFENSVTWAKNVQEDAGHDVSELEELLTAIMLEDFSAQVEDGSPGQVAARLIQWYQDCLAGNFAMMQQLQAVQCGANKSKGFTVDVDGAAVPCGAGDDASSSDGDDDDEMDTAGADAAQHGGDAMAMDTDEAPPQRGPIIDDDGFQLVGRRGRRAR